jgi:hypothetical protein
MDDAQRGQTPAMRFFKICFHRILHIPRREGV